MGNYGRIRRNTSSLGTGALFGRKRPNYRLMFYAAWALLMMVAILALTQAPSLQSKAAVLFAANPTTTPTAGEYARNAIAAYAKGDLNGAITNFRQAAQLAPQNVDVLYELTRMLIYRSFGDVRDLVNDIPEAKKWAQQAVTVAPANARAYTIQCFAQVRADAASDAVRSCLRALEIDANVADAHSYLSMAYYDLKRTSAALDQAEQAVKLDPESIDANIAYARALFYQGRPGAAMRYYQKAASINQNLEFPYFELAFFANTLANQNNGDEARYRIAIAAYEVVISKNPRSVKAYTRLCQTYLQKGDPKTARTYCQKATTIDPTYIDAWRWLGEVYHKSRNYEDAVDSFLTCEKLSDAQNIPKAQRDPTCWWLRAAGLYVLGNCTDAVKLVGDVLQWTNDNIAVTQSRIIIDKCQDDAALRGVYQTPTPAPSPTPPPTPIL